MRMKIAVLGGTGAMGSAIGAMLSEGGNDVTLVDVARDAVDAVNSRGLIIQEKSGQQRTVKIRATTEPSGVGVVDLVLVFVKCYHTADAVRGAAAMVGADTTVLSLQNGWGNAPRIAEIVGRAKVVPGVNYHSAAVLGPGHVLHAGKGMTFMGEQDGGISERVNRIAEAFRASKLDVTPSVNVLKEIWSKLALNAATLPNSAVTRITADRLLDTPQMQSLMQELLRETVAVANAQKIGLDCDERWAAITGLLGKLAPGTKGSMLQDVEKSRQTEIDVITGAVVAAGEKHNIPTPFNRSMLCLAKALERSYKV
jgi:2-dehydropantoate 2-reductase